MFHDAAAYGGAVTAMLPPAVAFAAWATAWLRGEVSVDEVGRHLGSGVPVLVGVPAAEGAEPLALGLGRLRSLGMEGVLASLPAPGDPLGLAGPPAFNAAALDVGGAVVLSGTGLGAVPAQVGGAVEWRCSPAAVPAPADPGETDRTLRSTLLEVTARLVDLDVATWQPEIPDALLNLRHRTGPALPPSYGGRRRETVERALLCLEIVALAGEVDAGAVTAAELEQRRAALVELDRAARRALVAACR
ncbi:MAG: hypothetical protein ACTHNS_15245 [Marmoricola sp.]